MIMHLLGFYIPYVCECSGINTDVCRDGYTWSVFIFCISALDSTGEHFATCLSATNIYNCWVTKLYISAFFYFSFYQNIVIFIIIQIIS